LRIFWKKAMMFFKKSPYLSISASDLWGRIQNSRTPNASIFIGKRATFNNDGLKTQPFERLGISLPASPRMQY